MAIRYIEAAPRRVQFFEKPEDVPGEIADRLSAADVTHVAEIFATPLTGSYNWDYRTADDRISKLYELGKRLNWNATLDVHWERTPDWHRAPAKSPDRVAEILGNSPWSGYGPWDAMSTEKKLEF